MEAYRNLLVVIAETPVKDRDFATQKLAKSNLETEEEHHQDMIHLLAEF